MDFHFGRPQSKYSELVGLLVIVRSFRKFDLVDNFCSFSGTSMVV